MITYKFEMIKNDCLIEMMFHRFIIERCFFAFGVPAVLCVIPDEQYIYKPYHTQNSRLKKSPIKFESMLSYEMIYDIRIDMTVQKFWSRR